MTWPPTIVGPSRRFTFSHSVMDDVIINKQSCCPEHSDRRGEAVVEGTALDVGLVRSDLRSDDGNFSFLRFLGDKKADKNYFHSNGEIFLETTDYMIL